MANSKGSFEMKLRPRQKYFTSSGDPLNLIRVITAEGWNILVAFLPPVYPGYYETIGYPCHEY